MEQSLSSSPERNEPVICKPTYLGNQKRKRALSKSNYHESVPFPSCTFPISKPTITDSFSSDSESSPVSKPPMKISNRTPKKIMPKIPASKGPKKVEVDLPGPSPPKRARHDSDESINAPKSSKAPRPRPPSSVGSVKQPPQYEPDSPPTSMKVESTFAPVKKPKSKAKSVVGDEDNDDNVSIADSSISVTRIRRNENERIEYYKNQPECSNVEPHSAHCRICDKSVNLGRKQTYAVRPWEIHRARCDKRAARDTPPSPVLSTFLVHAETGKPSSAVEDKVSSKPTPARRPTENERKVFLESDKQIKELDKDRALCGKCDTWVTLSDTHSYATGNWAKHKERCSDAVPSNRVAAAKRKLLVVNDKQVKSFTTRTIECANCGTAVQLEGDGDYNLTNWDAHKNRCVKNVNISNSDNVNSVAFPSQFSKSPTSATEETLIVDEASSSHLPQGLKRSREEDESLSREDDERPSARRRTMSYLPPQIEPPNTVMGWFMLPFHSFVRGFKESLKDRP